jgi:soluble lytic murein transglycosylase-like protein
MDPQTLRKTLAACALAAGALLGLGEARTLTATRDVVAEIDATPAPDRRREALADYLADRYRRDPDRVRDFVDEAHDAAETWDLDPLLVLAVMGVESSFNPAARSGFGATGLMQVVGRFHRDRLVEYGGEAALLDPRVNVRVGARILKDCLRRSGSVAAGLQRYAGWQDEEQRYARKVFSEKERLRRVVQHTARAPQDRGTAS